MFLGNEERDAAQILSDAMARDGIGIHLNTDTVRVRKEGNGKYCRTGERRLQIYDRGR